MNILIAIVLLLSSIFTANISIAQEATPSPSPTDNGPCKVTLNCGEKGFLTKEEIRAFNPKLSQKKINYLYNLQFKFTDVFKKEFTRDARFFTIPKSVCTDFNWTINTANGYLVKDSVDLLKSSGNTDFDNYVMHIVQLCEPFEGLVDDVPSGKYSEEKIRYIFSYLICKKENGKVITVK